MSRDQKKHFARHFAEMFLAMMIGMAVLGVPVGMALDQIHDGPALMLAGMAFDMTLPMALWMRYRGHGWASTLEMSAAMVIPALAAIALLAGGVVEGTGALMAIEHSAMVPAMLAAMLLRRDEYTGHAAHATAVA